MISPLVEPRVSIVVLLFIVIVTQLVTVIMLAMLTAQTID